MKLSWKLFKNLLTTTTNQSLLYKFSALFLMISILPLVILFYIYLQVDLKGSFSVAPKHFEITIALITIGITTGFFAMRAVIKQLIQLSEVNKEALSKVLDDKDMDELEAETDELAVLSQSFSKITDRLEENVVALESAKRSLQSVMSKVGYGIANMQNIDAFLDLIVETLVDAMNVRHGYLFVTQTQESDVMRLKSHFGKKLDQKFFDMDLTPSLIPAMQEVIDNKKVLNVAADGKTLSKLKDWGQIFEPPFMVSPLIIKEKCYGFLIVVAQANQSAFTEDDIAMLYNLSIQTATAIQNSRLSADIESTYFETISALALAVDAKDTYSRGHLDRVAKYALQIGRHIGLDDNDLSTLRDASRLHDIGKIGISDQILKKKGPLTEEEWFVMKKHPEIGESIIKPIHSLDHLCDIIRHHHEKLDGSGYPDGLAGHQISPLVRIITVADIFDALTSDRSYRSSYSVTEACQILRDMPEQLDQDIVEAFIETLNLS